MSSSISCRGHTWWGSCGRGSWFPLRTIWRCEPGCSASRNPPFVSDALRMSRTNDAVPVKRGSPERFGYSWDRYSEILPDHEEQFLRWTQPLAREDWKGVRFLDAGCGIGRNSFWPLRYGAAAGVLVDVDERSLARARDNLAGFPNASILHHSIYDLVESAAFDIVFSIGAVQQAAVVARALIVVAHHCGPVVRSASRPAAHRLLQAATSLLVPPPPRDRV